MFHHEKLHVAIVQHDMERVQALLETGEKLCTSTNSDCINCFSVAVLSRSDQSFIKELLQIEPQGVNAQVLDGFTLLEYFAYDSDFLSYLLTLGAADLSLHSCLLIKAVSASIFRTKTTRNSSDIEESLKILLSNGVNLLEEDENGCTVLCHAIKHSGEQYIGSRAGLIRFLINLPQYQDPRYPINCHSIELTPQATLLNVINISNILELMSMDVTSLTQIYDDLLTSRFKDTNAIYITKPLFSTFANDFQSPVPMCAISFFMNHRFSILLLNVIGIILKKLLSYGFSVSNPRGLSPLTILMSQKDWMIASSWHAQFLETGEMTIHDENPWLKKDPVLDKDHKVAVSLGTLFVDNGVNVQEKMLVSQHEYVQRLRDDLWIPDALWMAAIVGNFEAIDFLVPHSVCHPLALLLIIPRLTSEQLDVWYPNFAKYGPVPHGTQVYRDLCIKFGDGEEGINASDNVQIHFRAMHSNVLSLKELCRYSIRLTLGRAAAHPENTLSGLVRAVVPHFLTEYVLHPDKLI